MKVGIQILKGQFDRINFSKGSKIIFVNIIYNIKTFDNFK